MNYLSTRDNGIRVTSAEAIIRGLSQDGGLFVPDSFPSLTTRDITSLAVKPYYERAAYIMGLFLTDFTSDELNFYSSMAYNPTRFDNPDIAHLHKIQDNTYFLELWHGTTCAFKDMALQVMPHLLTASLKKTGEEREVCILVATSGDTGKAALEGFCDITGTKIMVFYPKDGVSKTQELQMTSQRGGNVNVVAVHGNFDDTQHGVKAILSNNTFSQELDKQKVFLSSANSINWGRLVPQIAYYVSAYCDLIESDAIKLGEPVNFCVPTGNFGNILAAYYALRIGLPIGKLICASNRNDVLTQFINTGVYDINRAFFTTISPSMDILVSSNLERLLFEIFGKDSGILSEYMSALSNEGRYCIPSDALVKIRSVFASGYCCEADTKKTIADTWNDSGYLIDTHTAVAYKALRDYRESAGDENVAVAVSTASPFKFCESVLEAIGEPSDAIINKRVNNDNGTRLLNILSEQTGIAIPAPLSHLKEAKMRFNEVIEPDEMKNAVMEFLGVK